MKRVVFVALAFCICLCVSGCKKTPETDDPKQEGNATYIEPSPGFSQAEPSTLPAVSNEETPVDLPQQTQVSEAEREAETNIWHLQNLIPSVHMFYTWYEYPIFYPVSEDTLNQLRDMLIDNNERFPDLQFDPYSIEVCEYGYRATVTYPLDYQDNPYYIWFEVKTDDTTVPRCTVVAVGPDGELSYTGASSQINTAGIGDDIIQFLTFDF